MSQFRLHVYIPFKTQSTKVPSRTIDNLNNPTPNKAVEFICKTFPQRKLQFQMPSLLHYFKYLSKK